MKKMIAVLGMAVSLVAMIANATQDSEISIKEVRDPRQLKTFLEANAGDAETRLVAAGATTAAAITLTNSSDNGVCTISLYSDRMDNAGDYGALITTAAGSLLWQTDVDAQGTLATKLTVANGGIITMKGSGTIDNTTDTGVINLTETLVQITGAGAISGDLTVTGGDVTGANGNAIDIGEAADGTITLSRDDAGTITLTSADNNADAALTISAGGSGALTLGDSGSTSEILSSDWAISTSGTITGASMDAAQLSGNIAGATLTNWVALARASGPWTTNTWLGGVAGGAMTTNVTVWSTAYGIIVSN